MVRGTLVGKIILAFKSFYTRFYVLAKLNYFWGALLTLVLFIACINNYIGNTALRIQADGIGYYDYLPATFIYHDLHRIHDSSGKLNVRVSELKGAYVETGNGNWVNKYAPGTAVLQLPFFLYTHFCVTGPTAGKLGYQLPYQNSVFYAALFYLFLSLVFTYLLLRTYQISPWIIGFIQLLLALATSLTHYVNVEASFSHVYSLFAITAFLFFARKFFLEQQSSSFLWSSFFFGLILLLRPVNILIVAALPFISGGFENLKDGFLYLFKRWFLAVKGIVIIALFVCFLSFVWYIQCQQWFLNTYESEEGFYFLNPQFFNILFSYKKGLFVYTPVLLIAFFSLIFWVKQKQYYTLYTWLGFFLLLTFILSSWWSWFYGCSYGLRAYIDFYPVFFIPIAIVLQQAKKWQRIGIIILGMACVYLNLVQTYQYKEYILHWIDMDKMAYWKVFGKTERKYKGILWKRTYNFNTYKLRKEINLTSLQDSVCHISSHEIPNFSEVSLLGITFHSNMREASNMLVYVKLKSVEDSAYYYDYHVPLIHFADPSLDKFEVWQNGSYFLEIPTAPEAQIEVFLMGKHAADTLSNASINFYSKVQ